MAINMMCMNSKCKYYWEDNCTRNMDEERIVMDSDGKCETFEEGISSWYTEDEPRFLLDIDSTCYGCKYFVDGEEGCTPPDICVEGSMNGYKMNC